MNYSAEYALFPETDFPWLKGESLLTASSPISTAPASLHLRLPTVLKEVCNNHVSFFFCQREGERYGGRERKREKGAISGNRGARLVWKRFDCWK